MLCKAEDLYVKIFHLGNQKLCISRTPRILGKGIREGHQVFNPYEGYFDKGFHAYHSFQYSNSTYSMFNFYFIISIYNLLLNLFKLVLKLL